MKRWLLILMMFICVLVVPSVMAVDTVLPLSDWYAVTWVEATDTLHWINAAGEQASIPRPTLPGQVSQANTRLHISPNGRYLVTISPLASGREVIGFYDFQTGQLLQTHESQANEVFLPAGKYPFTESSNHFVIPLRMQDSGAWRMIVFESASGNAIDQLTWDSTLLQGDIANNAALRPYVAQFNMDEAINTLEVRFQAVPTPETLQFTFPSFKWRIPLGELAQSITPDALPFNRQAGFDINPTTGAVVYASFDNQFGNPIAASDANTISTQQSADQSTVGVAQESGGKAQFARWLNDGGWIGYYRQAGAVLPHWTIMDANGQNAVPLGPNFIDVYHTRDGFLAKTTSGWRLDHAINLNFEGFSDTVGNTVFAPGQAFAVVYTTPANTLFALQSVADPVLAAVPLTVDANCAGAPAKRLTVNAAGRVTFTDGSPLRVRSAPAGDIVTQIQEGTVFNVIDGAQCVNTYNWWMIRLQNGTIGWAAEGDTEDYFMEPILQVANGIQATSTSTPAFVVGVAQVICAGSPSTQLQVGMVAKTQGNGTLAMRTNLTDEFPSNQVPAGVVVTVVGGSQCRENIRMWQVTTTLNGQQVTGWLAEGFGQVYYMVPN